MATFLKSASFTGTAGPYLLLELYYDLTQDIPNNKSTITYYLYVRSIGGTGHGTAAIGKINNIEVGRFTNIAVNENKYLGNLVVEVPHNNDGNKTVSYTAYCSPPWNNIGPASISGEIQLPTIPRYFTDTPIINLTDISETSLSCSWSTTENCSAISYSLNSGSSWTSVTMTAGTSGTFSITGLTAGTAYTVLTRFTRQDSGLTTDVSADKTTYDYPYLINIAPSENAVWSISETSTPVSLTFYNPLGRTVRVNLSVNDVSGYLLYRSENLTGISKQTSIQKSNLNDHITNDMSSPICYWLEYTLDGTNFIESSIKKYNTYQLRPEDCSPTLSDFSSGDANSVTLEVMNDSGATLVQNKSILKIRVQSSNYTLKNNATVRSISAAIGTQTFSISTSGSWTSLGNFNYDTTVPITLTLTDSRGLTSSKTKNLTFIAYEPPKVSLKANRTGGYGSNGSFTVVASYSSLNNKNAWLNSGAAAVKYTISPSTTTPSASGNVGTSNNINTTINITGADNETSYTITIYANDKISTNVVATAVIGKGTPTFSILTDNQTVGVNYVPEENEDPGLYVNGVFMLKVSDTFQNILDLIDPGGILEHLDAAHINMLDGESIESKVNKKVHFYNTVAEMQADSKLSSGNFAMTLGYYAANDGGSSLYRIITSSDTANGGNIISLANNSLRASLLVLNSTINYKQFGAHGDGETEDYTAIKNAHTFANLYNYNVEGVSADTYYIASINNAISVKTNIDFKNCNFIIDDTNTNSTQGDKWLFSIDSPNSITALTSGLPSVPKGTKMISSWGSYGDCIVMIYNQNINYWKRKGALSSDVTTLRDIFRIKNGKVLDDILFDFTSPTRAEIRNVEQDKPITIKNGNFTTKINKVNSYTYWKRGIIIQRNNVTIDNLKCNINENSATNSSPYRGFIYTYMCADVTIKNCMVVGHKAYQDSGTSTLKGNYIFNNEQCINIFYDNIIQTNNISDSNYWGIHTSNMCKNLYFNNCKMSRIDNHRFIQNLFVKDCILGYQGIKIGDGYGLFKADNTTIIAPVFLELREDYGSSWNGNVEINNCVLDATGTNSHDNNGIVFARNEFGFDFGHQTYLPNIKVNNFMLYKDSGSYEYASILDFYGQSSNFPVALDYTADIATNNSNSVYPIIFPKTIEAHHLRISNGGWFLVSPRCEIEYQYCENLGYINSNSNTNDGTSTSTIYNTNTKFILDDITFVDYTNESTYNITINSLWQKNNAGFPYQAQIGTGTHRPIMDIYISNCDNITFGACGRGIVSHMNNCDIYFIQAGQSGSAVYETYTDCRMHYTFPAGTNQKYLYLTSGQGKFINCQWILDDAYSTVPVSDFYQYNLPFANTQLISSDKYLAIANHFENNNMYDGCIDAFNQIKGNEYKQYGVNVIEVIINSNPKVYHPRRIGTYAQIPTQTIYYDLVDGDTYFDTTNNRILYYYNGSWKKNDGTNA